MGFLDKLWDETLAGPAPDSGLGKLRKYNSLIVRSAEQPLGGVAQHYGDGLSRSITVIGRHARPNLTVSVDSPSIPSSPSDSTAPSSPFSPSTPGGNFKKLTRRKSAPKPRSPATPTGYDWIVLSSLDR